MHTRVLTVAGTGTPPAWRVDQLIAPILPSMRWDSATGPVHRVALGR